MIGKKAEFEAWCKDIRLRYEQEYGEVPDGAPNLVCLDSHIQERMMRCKVEATTFDIDDNRDDLAILAYHTLLDDEIKYPPFLHRLKKKGFTLTSDRKLVRI